MNSRRKKIDLILIILWPIIASIASFLLQTNFLESIILFLVIPSLYLSLRNKEFIKKSFIFSLAALPILVVIGYVSVKTGTWFFPVSVFNYRLFGVIAFEEWIWFISWVYFISMFYEYFLDEKCTHKFTNPRLKYPVIAFLCLLIIFLGTLFFTGTFLKIPYFYLLFGIVFAVLPIIFVFLKLPNLLTKFAEATLYFSFMSFLWELVAIPLGHWSFPGNSFIGWVQVFGVSFPFEEFFIWILLGAAGILSWYEFFDDDKK